MTSLIRLGIVVLMASVAFCDQASHQQQNVPDTVSGWIPKIRRTYRSVSPLFARSASVAPSFGAPEYTLQLRPRIARLSALASNQPSSYAPLPTITRSYRRFRSAIPNILSMENGSDGELSGQQPASDQGRLRFLGWLFGRPSISPYPDYSLLEDAAGLSSPFGLGSRYPHARPYPPVVVEECVEMLDPYTHQIIEECQDVPTYH